MLLHVRADSVIKSLRLNVNSRPAAIVEALPSSGSTLTVPSLVFGFVTDRAFAAFSCSGAVGAQGVGKIMIGITVASLVITDRNHQFTQPRIRF